VVSTEWIVLVWFHKMCALVTITNSLSTGNQLENSNRGEQPAAFSKYLCGGAHIIQSVSYAHWFKLNEFKPY